MILIQKNLDLSVEFFGFSGSSTNCFLDQLCLNHRWVFNSFAAYFKKELNPILLRMEEEADSLLKLKGDDFFAKPCGLPRIDPAKLHNYLKDIGKEDEMAKFQLLSPREKQCIELLLQGKSAKESATILQLSPRTIECYFENIKNKLVCHSKREIFNLSKNYEELGSVP